MPTPTRGRHDMNAIATVVVGITIALSLSMSPVMARATTLDELQVQLERAQADSDVRQTEYEQAQAELQRTLSGTYKENATSAPEILSTPNSVGKALMAIKYGNAVTDKVVSQIQAESYAKRAADDAKAKVESLIEQERRQKASLQNADSIHFAQWDPRWGTVRYWNGTITTHGCGLVAYTVMVDILTGRNATPDQILAERGDWAGTEQTIDSTTGGHGRTHRQVTYDLYGVTTEELSLAGDRRATLDAVLDGESVVQVCAAGQAFKNSDGYWRWSGGHYILIYRKDDSGCYYVQDSTWQAKGQAVQYTASDMNHLLACAHSLVAYHN